MDASSSLSMENCLCCLLKTPTRLVLALCSVSFLVRWEPPPSLLAAPVPPRPHAQMASRTKTNSILIVAGFAEATGMMIAVTPNPCQARVVMVHLIRMKIAQIVAESAGVIGQMAIVTPDKMPAPSAMMVGIGNCTQLAT